MRFAIETRTALQNSNRSSIAGPCLPLKIRRNTALLPADLHDATPVTLIPIAKVAGQQAGRPMPF